MRQTIVSSSGSARSLSTLPVSVAGKTGTAQWNRNKENHAWFTAFAPYNNPSFVITVLVEEGGGGSAVAAPIAKDILRYWFSR
jgi:cell division protein FtsI/penicillin-binding protein 2